MIGCANQSWFKLAGIGGDRCTGLWNEILFKPSFYCVMAKLSTSTSDNLILSFTTYGLAQSASLKPHFVHIHVVRQFVKDIRRLLVSGTWRNIARSSGNVVNEIQPSAEPVNRWFSSSGFTCLVNHAITFLGHKVPDVYAALSVGIFSVRTKAGWSKTKYNRQTEL
jgi:hypothetical protein